MTSTEMKNLELTVRRTFDASADRVFRAWTDAKQLQEWYRPSEQHQTVDVAMDLRVGGRFRIRMRNPQGEVHAAGGVFQEIDAPKKLVYSWRWENALPGGAIWDVDSLVTVEFLAKAEKTEVVVKHEKLGNDMSVKLHNHGWEGCLMMLGKYLTLKEDVR